MGVTDGLHLAALAAYALAAALLGVSLARSARRLPAAAAACLALGVALHGGALAAYRGQYGEWPLVGLGPSLSVLALLIALGSLLLATLARTGPLGLVLVPVAAGLAGVATVAGLRPAAHEVVFRGPWFALHVILAMLGYAGLTVAFAAGLMYLLQFRQLKGKRFGAVFRFFPPLDTLDRVGRRALIAGLPLLTLALLLGWAWSERFGPPMRAGNPKVVLGVLTVAVFVAALASRAGQGAARARRGALASVVGFAVVVVAYVLMRAAESSGAGFL
jgi:HemX protein